MSDATSPGKGSEIDSRTDRACDRFEEAWLAGKHPCIEDFLRQAPADYQRTLLRELLKVELAYRRRTGEEVTPESYITRFPDKSELILEYFAEGAAPQDAATLPPAATLDHGSPSTQDAATLPPPGDPGDDQPTVRAASTDTHVRVPGYEILGTLGRGGMGIVYRARQVALKREVALKMILGADYAGTSDIARFRAEAEAVARLQHPHIVTVHEVGEHAGRQFFSMEYCPGGSLATACTGPMSARPAAELLLKISRGVAAAHAAGIVHRDLKPGNVLLGADGIPKVSDFGLAKRIGRTDQGPAQELTGSGAVLGTPSYMAPEQAGGARRVGPAADVYALGVILYELLSGRPPFRGATPADTLLLLLTEDPPPLRAACPSVPRDLEAICVRCLDKDPARRYPTAAELADDLARFLEGEPVSALQSGMVSRLVGSLERVPLHERYAMYGSLLLAQIPIMCLPEILTTLVVWNDWPAWLLHAGQSCRLAAYLLLLGCYRGWRWGPQGVGERLMWMVWGGYLLCCCAFGLSFRLLFGFGNLEMEFALYPGLACLTALAFFALAANVWGYFLTIGAAFVVLAPVMTINLRWAALEFGAAWTAVLLLIGLRLRRLGRLREPA